MQLNPPGGMRNLTMWFAYNEAGEIDRITELKAVDPKLDLEVELAKMSVKSAYVQANVYTFKKERITTPEYLFGGVDNVAIVMYYHGKKHRAILPLYLALSEL